MSKKDVTVVACLDAKQASRQESREAMLRDFCTRVIHLCEYVDLACTKQLTDIELLRDVALRLRAEAVGVSKAVGR